MKSSGSLLAAAAMSVALTTTPSISDARGGRSMSFPKFTLPASRRTPSTQPNSVPQSPRVPEVTRGVSAWAKRALDIVAPKSDFMRYWLAMRAWIAGAQYIALTPTNLDMVAHAQYRAMLDNAPILPDNHPTTIRVKNIVKKLTDTVRFDPRISTEIHERMQWEVNVIQSDVINAFCMPGGKMAIYTGIIDRLQLTDDEIAVVMAHEIAHALRDHGYKRVRSQIMTNLGISTVWALTWRHVYAADIANVLWQLSHSREHEHEADSDGLDIARMAGYDSCAGERVWNKMRGISRSRPPEFLTTHPDNEDRAQRLRDQAKRSGGKC